MGNQLERVSPPGFGHKIIINDRKFSYSKFFRHQNFGQNQ